MASVQRGPSWGRVLWRGVGNVPKGRGHRYALVFGIICGAVFRLAVPPPAQAQVLRGTVVDSISGRPLAGAHVRALNARSVTVGDTVTGPKGDFTFTLPIVGDYRLQAVRIGYVTAVTQPMPVGSTRELYVQLRLAANPVPLDTITVVPATVVPESEIPWLARAGFYDRRREGFGRFLTRADIEGRHPLVVTDVLRGLPGVEVLCANRTSQQCDIEMPGASTMFFRGPCHPTIVLDGVVVRAGGIGTAGDAKPDQVLNPFNIEALEVYTSSAGLPVQYQGYLSPCGAILAWSRR